jgi:hypothetical protein
VSVTADDYWAQIPESVLYADISDKAIRLYAVLRRYADKDTGVGHPGQSTLARRMRCSVPSVKRATAELEAIGVLRVDRRFDPESPARKLPNEYHILTLPRFTGEPTPEVMGEPTPKVTGELSTRVSEPESVEPDTAKKTKEREPDLMFEAIAEVCGIDWHNLTNGARGPLNRATKDIKAVCAEPAEVRLRAANWPYDVPLTPPGLAKHWPALDHPPPEPGQAEIRRALERIHQDRRT